MSGPNKIYEATILDREGNPIQVRKRDLVDLMEPISSSDGGDEDEHYYWARQAYDSNSEWLGEGPYRISWMARWPCGRVMIYVESPTSPGAGVHAEDLVAVREVSEVSEGTGVV